MERNINQLASLITSLGASGYVLTFKQGSDEGSIQVSLEKEKYLFSFGFPEDSLYREDSMVRLLKTLKKHLDDSIMHPESWEGTSK